MSKRDVRLYVTDILEAIEKIRSYTAGFSYAQFEKDNLVVDAVTRNLEIIGEAAKYIPPELRARHAQVDWSRVVGFRNIVIHAYFDVDLEIVWTISTQRLAELEKALRKMLEELEQGNP